MSKEISDWRIFTGTGNHCLEPGMDLKIGYSFLEPGKQFLESGDRI